MVLNVKKTKEIIFDFRVKKTIIKSINLCQLEIERVSSFKLLGIGLMIISNGIETLTISLKKQKEAVVFS